MDKIKTVPDTGLTGLEIAVIGMSCRFPGARNYNEFWESLTRGTDSISYFSDEELVQSRIETTLRENPGYVRADGVFARADYFDASFFDYTPPEALKMDPQMRIFHECTWEALEDSGYDPMACNCRIGIYAGASDNLYWQALTSLGDPGNASEQFALQQVNNKDYLATQISFKLNLTGPAVAIYTACSTSLVTIHEACQGLLNGECDIALAGGVTVSLPLIKGYLYQEGMIMSPDGHCRAFDARARGFVGGSGAGVVVLKPLEEALGAGDYIYALVKGSAINNDGARKADYTAPSVEGQAEAINVAHHLAEVAPESIGYLETHGTGTPLGDAVENEALKLAFNTVKKGFCYIGTVKNNVGHLDSAAGVAGFIKTVLALKHRLIPPHIHFENPNPKIDLQHTPFRINTCLTRWKRGKYPLRAGVSSFGIGGTNAHVILEEAPGNRSTAAQAVPLSREQYREPAFQLLLLSARTTEALRQMIRNLARHLEMNRRQSLADIAYTLQAGRRYFEYRQYFVCSDIQQAMSLLSASAAEKNPGFFNIPKKPSIVFMFSGQGTQYVNMGLDLYREVPEFSKEMDHCFFLLKGLLKDDVKEILYPGTDIGETEEKLNRIVYTQPLKFCFEYSLARLLMRWGIKPDAMIGHSFGEYIAACLAGVFSLEDALKLVILRGELMEEMPPGAMTGVPLSGEEIKPYLNDQISLAAVNSPLLCTLSGPGNAISILENQLAEQGIEAKRLRVSRASHSQMMAPIVERFEREARGIAFHKPCIPYISGLTGQWITPEQAANPAYWASHLQKTILFSEGLAQLFTLEKAIFVQLGPGTELTGFVSQHPGKKPEHLTINTLRRRSEEVSDIYYTLARLGQFWSYGVDLRLDGCYPGIPGNRVPLPTYPFAGKRYWPEGDPLDLGEELVGKNHRSRLYKMKNISNWFYQPSWKRSTLPVKKDRPGTGMSCRLWFLNPGGLAHRLLEKMKKTGKKKIPGPLPVDIIVAVSRAPGFERLDDLNFRVNPGKKEHYRILFKELKTRGIIPDQIVHAWNLGSDITLGQEDKNLEMGFYSLLFMVQAIGEANLIKEMEISVLTSDIQSVTGVERLCPGKATVLGLIKGISQEYSYIRCRSIDILPPEPPPGTNREQELLHHLEQELTTTSPEQVVAWRGSYRWVQTFEPLLLPEVRAGSIPRRLKPGGVYLITGGYGGMGLILAEYLAKTLQAKLVLTGRSPLTQAGERKIDELKTTGAEVMVLRAEVSDLQQMEAAIAGTIERFGLLNGVIHAAGVTRGPSFGPINELQSCDCQDQFQAKVAGLRVLEKVLETVKTDFCLLTSSVASILGGLGYSGYASANCFLDAFVQQRHQPANPTHWISVNWESWENWQTHREENQPQALGAVNAQLTMSFQEGLDVFKRILDWENARQVVVSCGDLQTRINQWTKIESAGDQPDSPSEELPGQNPRPQIQTEFIPPANSLEKTLASIWQKAFAVCEVGIDDDFFELGGNSLMAITVAAKIHKAVNTRVPASEFFKRPTIRHLARYVQEASQDNYSPIDPAEKKETYVLSSPQKRIYIQNQLGKKSINYNISSMKIMEGKIDRTRFEETFKILIKRHESLRTSFMMVKGKTVQVIREHVPFTIHYEETSPQEAEEAVRRLIKPFSLEEPPLLRAALIKTDTQAQILVLDMHHIIADGVSTSIFLMEFIEQYKGEKLPPLKLQYKDYAEWKNREQKRESIKKQETYWIGKFTGDIPQLNLPLDYPREEVRGFEGKALHFKIGPEETRTLKKMALENEATLFMVILAVTNVLMLRLTGQEDIIIGTPVAGRRHTDLEHLIGMFVNNLVIRNRPSPEKTFSQFLKELKRETLEAFENQDYPFEELVEKVVKKRDRSRNPLFDVMLMLLNVSFPQLEIPGLKIKPYEVDKKTSMFDLLFQVHEADEMLLFILEYNTRLFKETTANHIALCFKEVVAQIIDKPKERLSCTFQPSGDINDEMFKHFNEDLENE